jgi:hypothetical protein
LQRGAVSWPNPHDSDELSQALAKAADTVAAEPKQETLSFALREQPPPFGTEKKELPPPPPEAGGRAATLPPDQELMNLVREILVRELTEPKSEAAVAELLKVSKPQAKLWLTRLVADGGLEKVPKPLRYRAARTAAILL